MAIRSTKRQRGGKPKISISHHAIVSGDAKNAYIPSARELKGALKSGRAQKEDAGRGRWTIFYQDKIYITNDAITVIITTLTPLQHNTIKFFKDQAEGKFNLKLAKKNFGVE